MRDDNGSVVCFTPETYSLSPHRSGGSRVRDLVYSPMGRSSSRRRREGRFLEKGAELATGLPLLSKAQVQDERNIPGFHMKPWPEDKYEI